MIESADSLIGKKFNRLTVISFFGTHQNKNKWRCKCICGNFCLVTAHKLKSGHTQSCGCLHKEGPKHLTTHGLRYHSAYTSYVHMLDRCNNNTHVSFSNYGGRGIKICERWLDSKKGLLNFIEDMGERPEGYHIDRIDNNGPYSKENCRWISPGDNSRNKRNTFFISFNGKTQCITDWAVEIGVSTQCIKYRLSVGKTVEEALTAPSQRPKLIKH